MKVNSNKWNKIRYTIYQPVYDLAGNIFKLYRKSSIEKLNLNPDDKILILGAGTGLDLEFLQKQKQIDAIDITESMLDKLVRKADKLDMDVEVKVMDGQNLEYENNTFDVVILHLIVAVIPDPVKCMKEVERVLKPGGKFTIMDKFITSGTKPSLARKLLDPITNFLFSSINRDIDVILSHTNLKKDYDETLQASYRIVNGTK